MKAKGIEIEAFYKAWPMGPDWYHEDGTAEPTKDDGLGLMPAEEYDVDDVIGDLCWQGRGMMPRSLQINKTTIRWLLDGPQASAIFAAWRATSRVVVLLLTDEQQAELTTFCRSKGWPDPA